MKNSKNVLRTSAIALLAGLGLAGCVAVPMYEGAGYYGPPAVIAVPVLRPHYSRAHRGGYDGGRYGGYRDGRH